MLVEDGDAPLLKIWVIKKLEHISDADSDVLADYVLALVKTDDPAHVAKRNCIENLQDFIGDSSGPFVNDLFDAIAAKSYDPSQPPPPKAVVQPNTNPLFAQSLHGSTGNAHLQNGSRKRNSREWDNNGDGNDRNVQFEGNRPMKQPRRGGRRGSDVRGGRFNNNHNGRPSFAGQQQPPPGFPQMPMPPFDPSNPMASILAMQQIMGLLPGGVPGFPAADQSQASNGFGQNHSAQRCNDYDTKGFCERGAQCPYEHGSEAFVVGGANMEYDPAQSSLLDVQPGRSRHGKPIPNERGRGSHRGRGRGSANARGGRRSDFSLTGPMNNRSATTIVVEQIPEDKFGEQTVKDFFSEFGDIVEVDMQAYKRLAIIKFKDHDAAKAAYDSPKSVFDNRFVKVYWYKPDSVPRLANNSAIPRSSNRMASSDVDMGGTEQAADPVEFAKKQEEAQRKHDDVKKQLEEQDKQRSDLDMKLKAIEAEKKRMAAKLAQKSGGQMPSTTATAVNAESNGGDQNEALKAKLAALQAEAKSLGIDPDAPTNNNSWSGFPSRSRGGYRGRPGRGNYYAARGRGGWAGGAVKRLDNRPKTVAVTFSEGVYEDHEETLRQWLFFNNPSESKSAALSKHPARQDVALLAFPERYLGEVFMGAASTSDFPLAGRIELSWHRPEASTSNGTGTAADVVAKTTQQTGDVDATPSKENEYMYDVAGDDDY